MLYHYLKGNILHLSPLVIERILRNADKTSKNGKFDHFFYITLFDDKMLYFHNDVRSIYDDLFRKYDINNYMFIDSKYLFFKTFFNLNGKIFFHGSTSPFWMQLLLYTILIILRLDEKAKKVTLVCWGETDFYNHGKKYSTFIQKIFSQIFNHINALVALSPGDMHLIEKLYPTANCENIPYIASREIKRKEKKGRNINIMISHSGWPHNQHFYSFELLSSYAFENIDVFCPLCYGDKVYIEDVIKRGKEIFGDKFHYFVDLKSTEEYDDFLHSIDVYVSAAAIQTGLYALMTTMLSGAKAYITGNLYSSMKEYGFIVNDLKTLSDLPFEQFATVLDSESYNHNVNVYSFKYVNVEELQGKWKRIYSE